MKTDSERRRSPRLPTDGSVSFMGTHVAGGGQLYNLSLHGCAIGGYIPVPVGTHLRLNLHLVSGEEPVLIELGTVRWAQELRCGVEFLVASVSEQSRLHAHLESLTRSFRRDS